jgi:diguanylate cyclase (GGDEF)-like protein
MMDKIGVTSTPWRSLPGLDQLLVAPSAPQDFIAALLDMLVIIPGIDAAWVGRPNDDGLLLPEAVRAPDMAVLSDPAIMVNVREGPCSHAPAGRAWRTGVAQMSSDVGADDTLTPWRSDWLGLGFRVSASIPLNGVCGVHRVLSLYSREPAFFRITWPLSSMTEFGLLIGTAIESRVKHQALQRSKRLLDTMFVSAETLLDADSETAVLRGICKRLSETGLFIGAAIGRVDKDGVFGYKIAAGKDAAGVRKLRQPFDQTGPRQLLGIQAWKSDALCTADGYASLARLEPWRDIALGGGWQSAAAAPIRRAGTIFATLFLVSGDASVVDAETQRLIGQLARNIGRALDEIDLKFALRAERETQSKFARHDKLTDLPNRRAFEEALPSALAHAVRHGSVIGLGILDLDNFKPVNDRFGHGAGDIVLRTLARRIRATLRDVDFVARLGGDEFALIIEDMTSISHLSGFCAQLGNVIRRPITLDSGDEVVMSASLGLTFFPADQEPPDTLIRHADIALYGSKAVKSTRSRDWMTYQEFIGSAPAQSYCRTLLVDDRVEVHYQPVIAVASGSVIAVEGLARLRDADRLIQPNEFLPELTADDRATLFASVLRQGVGCLRRLGSLAPSLKLSINVDAEVLARGRVPAMLAAALEGSGITPDRLIVELLESHEFPDPDSARDRLGELRACGVSIALDDLGIEFSTLKRVQRLPIDHLKIDKIFLADVMRNPNDLVFLATYMTIAATLGLSLCIEGVKTLAMLDALRILGAPMAQGFGISRPIPEAGLASWLTDGAPKPIKGVPLTLLGAYALYIRWLRVFLFAPNDPSLRHYLRRDSTLSLQRFLRQAGLAQTPLGHAYEALMRLTDQSDFDVPEITFASDRVRLLLGEAVTAEDSARTAPANPPHAAPQPAQRITERPVRQSRRAGQGCEVGCEVGPAVLDRGYAIERGVIVGGTV